VFKFEHDNPLRLPVDHHPTIMSRTYRDRRSFLLPSHPG
jgi:hypothetical protein